MRNSTMTFSAILALMIVSMLARVSLAQDKAVPNVAEPPKAADADTQKNYDQFAKTMSSAKLVGHFTITGKTDKELTSEEYHILEVKRMDEGDYWLFKVRIKYGGRDVTVPIPIEVKWAANTPVITLDNVEVPLMGTFSSRVVIDGDKYAGTWSHGDVGGHLFGRIVPGEAEAGGDKSSPDDQ